MLKNVCPFGDLCSWVAVSACISRFLFTSLLYYLTFSQCPHLSLCNILHCLYVHVMLYFVVQRFLFFFKTGLFNVASVFSLTCIRLSGWDHVTQGLVQLGFMLMDSNAPKSSGMFMQLVHVRAWLRGAEWQSTCNANCFSFAICLDKPFCWSRSCWLFLRHRASIWLICNSEYPNLLNYYLGQCFHI